MYRYLALKFQNNLHQRAGQLLQCPKLQFKSVNANRNILALYTNENAFMSLNFCHCFYW